MALMGKLENITFSHIKLKKSHLFTTIHQKQNEEDISFDHKHSDLSFWTRNRGQARCNKTRCLATLTQLSLLLYSSLLCVPTSLIFTTKMASQLGYSTDYHTNSRSGVLEKLFILYNTRKITFDQTINRSSPINY